MWLTRFLLLMLTLLVAAPALAAGTPGLGCSLEVGRVGETESAHQQERGLL
jgi:hypothetical protein